MPPTKDPPAHRMPAGEPAAHRMPAGEPPAHRLPDGEPPAHRMPARPVLPSLTALRAPAAVAIFLFHSLFLLPHWLPNGTRSALAATAPSAVSFFFVLSGFVLAWGRPAGGSTGAFLRRRVARLVPLYLFVWLGALAVEVASRTVPSARGIAASGLLVQAWFPRPGVTLAVNPVGWSLSCEVVFSALLPVLLLGASRLTPRGRLVALGLLVVAVLVLAVGASAGSPPTEVRTWLVAYSPLTRLAEFAAGVLAAVTVAAGCRRIPLALSLLVLAVSLVVTSRTSLLYHWAAVTMTAYLLLVVAAAQSDLTGRTGVSALLRARPLVRLGHWSYAFYLAHVPVGFLLLYAVGKARLEQHPWVSLSVWFVLAGSLSAFAHAVIEVPLSRRLRR